MSDLMTARSWEPLAAKQGQIVTLPCSTVFDSRFEVFVEKHCEYNDCSVCSHDIVLPIL